MKLIRLLNQWAVEGLITADQRDRIISFEAEKNLVSRPRIVLYAFIILGAAVIGIGIISLIAANWKNIPPYVKLTNNFLILCAAAYGVNRVSGNEKNIFFDGAVVLFSMLVMASIGLISQVFHTGGELHQAMFIWLALILPLVTMSRNSFPVQLWTASFMIAATLWAMTENSFWSNQGGVNKTSDYLVYYATLPFFSSFTANILSITGNFSGNAFLKKFSESFFVWSAITGILSVLMTDVIYSDASQSMFSMRVVTLLIVFSAAASLSAYANSIFTKKEKAMTIVIAALMVLMYVIPVNTQIDRVYDSFPIAGPMFSIAALLIYSMLFISRDMNRIFNAMTLLIGIRFLIVYFQVIGDLATTGLGLIFSGFVIIGVSMLWFKKRDALAELLGGLIK